MKVGNAEKQNNPAAQDCFVVIVDSPAPGIGIPISY